MVHFPKIELLETRISRYWRRYHTSKDDHDSLVGAVGRSVQAYQRSTDALDDAVAERLGVNRSDLRCLDALYEGPRTIGQLADATGLSSAAATALIDRLELKGFVRRVRDSADRRKILVELTSDAMEQSGRLYGPLVAEGARLLADYSKGELSLLRRYLVAAKEITDRHRRSVARVPGQDARHSGPSAIEEPQGGSSDGRDAPSQTLLPPSRNATGAGNHGRIQRSSRSSNRSRPARAALTEDLDAPPEPHGV